MYFIIPCPFGEESGLVVSDVLLPINLKALLRIMGKYSVVMKSMYRILLILSI